VADERVRQNDLLERGIVAIERIADRLDSLVDTVDAYKPNGTPEKQSWLRMFVDGNVVTR